MQEIIGGGYRMELATILISAEFGGKHDRLGMYAHDSRECTPDICTAV